MLHRLPHEKIVRVNYLLMALNEKLAKPGAKRVVDLACGHSAYTKNRTKARCVRCEEMLRRSIETGEEDYEAFRRGVRRDDMTWREDPCRQLNERTDLAGNYVNDTEES